MAGPRRSFDIHRIDLEPIDPDDTTRMAESLLDGALQPSAANALWDLTLGIPLYLCEAASVAALVASGLLIPPRSLTDIVALN
jgi:hypothetical protein